MCNHLGVQLEGVDFLLGSRLLKSKDEICQSREAKIGQLFLGQMLERFGVGFLFSSLSFLVRLIGQPLLWVTSSMLQSLPHVQRLNEFQEDEHPKMGSRYETT